MKIRYNKSALAMRRLKLVMSKEIIMGIKNNNLNINKYRILLNESVNPLKQYFSLYDIKSIIKANIDYHISNEFYITDIEKEIMDGKIITLNSKALKHYQNDYTALLNLAADIMGGNKDE